MAENGAPNGKNGASRKVVSDRDESAVARIVGGKLTSDVGMYELRRHLKRKAESLDADDPIRLAMERGDFRDPPDPQEFFSELFSEYRMLREHEKNLKGSESRRQRVIVEMGKVIEEYFKRMPPVMRGAMLSEIKGEAGPEAKGWSVDREGNFRFSDGQDVYSAAMGHVAASRLIGLRMLDELEGEKAEREEARKRHKEKKAAAGVDETELSTVRRSIEGDASDEVSSIRRSIISGRAKEEMDKARIRDEITRAFTFAVEDQVGSGKAAKIIGDSATRGLIESCVDAIYNGNILTMQADKFREISPELKDVGVETIFSDVIRRMKKWKKAAEDESEKSAAIGAYIRETVGYLNDAIDRMGMDEPRIEDFNSFFESCGGSYRNALEAVMAKVKKLVESAAASRESCGISPEEVESIKGRIKDMESIEEFYKGQFDMQFSLIKSMEKECGARCDAAESMDEWNASMEKAFMEFGKSFRLPRAGYVQIREGKERPSGVDFAYAIGERSKWLYNFSLLIDSMGSGRQNAAAEQYLSGFFGGMFKREFKSLGRLGRYLKAHRKRCEVMLESQRKADRSLGRYMQDYDGMGSR